MFPTFSRSIDKRRVSRGRIHVTARYLSAHLALEGVVTDVSAEGLFFASDFLDARGEMARLSVFLPARPEPLELRGEVRWVNDAPLGSGMGIRLVDVSLEDRILLASLPALLEGSQGSARTGYA
ncbi:MAG: PilZ domain-containing protein [Myxococcales bacterium]|nr:PilZ domain-containing protein [Myxococcales bacterium]